MKAEDVHAAIAHGSVIVYEGGLRKIMFEPKALLKDGFAEAKLTINSRTLENGKFPAFCCQYNLCRMATPKEAKRFNELKQRSKYLIYD